MFALFERTAHVMVGFPTAVEVSGCPARLLLCKYHVTPSRGGGSTSELQGLLTICLLAVAGGLIDAAVN